MHHCTNCDWVTKIDKTDTSLELLRRAKEEPKNYVRSKTAARSPMSRQRFQSLSEINYN